MRMDAQPIKKLLSACPALLGHDFKFPRAPLAEGNCLYRGRFSRPPFAGLGKIGVHEAVTSERGRSNKHLNTHLLFSRTKLSVQSV